MRSENGKSRARSESWPGHDGRDRPPGSLPRAPLEKLPPTHKIFFPDTTSTSVPKAQLLADAVRRRTEPRREEEASRPQMSIHGRWAVCDRPPEETRVAESWLPVVGGLEDWSTARQCRPWHDLEIEMHGQGILGVATVSVEGNRNERNAMKRNRCWGISDRVKKTWGE